MRKLVLFAFSFPALGAEDLLQWTRQFGTARFDDAVGIAASSNTTYTLYSSATSVPDLPEYSLRKLALDGSTAWSIPVTLPMAIRLRALAADDTGVYVAGLVSAESIDVLVRKYDPNGALVWSRQFGTPHWDEATAIAIAGGSVYVVGTTNSVFEGQSSPAPGSFDAFVAKLDAAAGNTAWIRQYGTTVTDSAGSVAVAGDVVYVAGLHQGTSRALAAFDSSGTQLWLRDLGPNGLTSIVAQGPALFGLAETGAVLLKLDLSGGIVWRRSTSSDESYFGLAADETGVYGAGVSFTAGNRDATLVKYDGDGNVLWRRPLRTGAPESFSAVTAASGRVCTLGVTEGSLQGTNAGSSDVFVQSYENAFGLYFVPLSRCRVFDSGSETLAAGETRTFQVTQGYCGVPVDAQAFALEIGVNPSEPLGFLSVWPGGALRPLVSTLNSPHGGPVWNSALIRAGTGGTLSVYSSNRTSLAIDVTGYFTTGWKQAHSYYPSGPCRLLDTRRPGAAPAITANISHRFSHAPCGLPPSTAALCVNATVVPSQTLASLALWMTGAPPPVHPLLSSPDGLVTARSTILPSGNYGTVSVLASNNADLVVDVTGYFGPGYSGGLRFYPLTGCRAADTRLSGGALAAGETRDFPITGRCGVPSTAKSLAMNVTAVPSGPLAYVTAWPAGRPRPLVSSLNSPLGRVIANSVISSAGVSGAVSLFATHETHLVIDVTGYFE